jgi:hypothetical protein
MRVILRILVVGSFAALASCSKENGGLSADVWVTASSLGPSSGPYTPRPIITARESENGMWIWHPQWGTAETINLEQLLNKVTEARAFDPEPLILFSFARHADIAELAELRSRIASAAGCSSLEPCVEGTPEQLR